MCVQIIHCPSPALFFERGYKCVSATKVSGRQDIPANRNRHIIEGKVVDLTLLGPHFCGSRIVVVDVVASALIIL